MLDSLLADDPQLRAQAGDYFLKSMPRLVNLVLPPVQLLDDTAQLPFGINAHSRELDTVVYSSRKSFLREHSEEDGIQYIDDVQLERYYKNYLEGMGETEKAFVAAVSRLGRYPVVGGLAIHWQAQGVYIDCHFHLYQIGLTDAFTLALNNVVTLARAIAKVGTFKACLFDARQTIHLARDNAEDAFLVPPGLHIPYEVKAVNNAELSSKQHSYFEDGKDPDEQLVLPDAIMDDLAQLNLIRHTGCIIFEVTAFYMKVHSYFHLLDADAQPQFSTLLSSIVSKIPLIRGEGVGGFMKLPHKATRKFTHQLVQTTKVYPANPYSQSS
jgi:non-specific serine/threonine protein kinase